MSPLRIACILWCLFAALVVHSDSAAAPAGHAPTNATLRPKALIAEDPRVGADLEDSLRKADWRGLRTLDEFYAFVDDTVRLVPTVEDSWTGIRPFFLCDRPVRGAEEQCRLPGLGEALSRDLGRVH